MTNRQGRRRRQKRHKARRKERKTFERFGWPSPNDWARTAWLNAYVTTSGSVWWGFDR